MAPSGFINCQPAGGNVLPSNPSAKGSAAPTPLYPFTVLQSSIASASTTPFGREEQTCIVFVPGASVIAFKGTVTEAREARLPDQLNVCTVVPLLLTVIVADVIVLDPAFFKITDNY